MSLWPRGKDRETIEVVGGGLTADTTVPANTTVTECTLAGQAQRDNLPFYQAAA